MDKYYNFDIFTGLLQNVYFGVFTRLYSVRGTISQQAQMLKALQAPRTVCSPGG
jgi:hypothetical protein